MSPLALISRARASIFDFTFAESFAELAANGPTTAVVDFSPAVVVVVVAGGVVGGRDTGGEVGGDVVVVGGDVVEVVVVGGDVVVVVPVGEYSATQSTSVDSGAVGHPQPHIHHVCCVMSKFIGTVGISDVVVI